MSSIVPRAYPKKPKKPKLGRPPRAAKAATIIVTLRLTKAEHEAWLRAAGERPLGEWIRERCAVTTEAK